MKNHFTNFLIGNDLTATNKLRKILLWRDQKNAAYASKINQLNHTQWILDEYLGLVSYYVQGLTDLLLNATVDGPTSALLQVNYTTTPPKVGLIPSLNCLVSSIPGVKQGRCLKALLPAHAHPNTPTLTSFTFTHSRTRQPADTKILFFFHNVARRG